MTEGRFNRANGAGEHGVGQSLWQSCVDQLAQELPEQQFNTWIRPLPPAEVIHAEGVTCVSVL